MLARLPTKSLYKNLAQSLICPRKIATVGEYIINSLKDKEISHCYGYRNNPYTPFYKYIKEDENFELILEKYEPNSAYKALAYAKNTCNYGVVVNSCIENINNISVPLQIAKLEKRPILVLSFFEDDIKTNLLKLNIKNFCKESITVKTNNNFPKVMEELLSYGYIFPSAPVHLNIANNILDLPISYTNNENIPKILSSGHESHSDKAFSRDISKMYKKSLLKK